MKEASNISGVIDKKITKWHPIVISLVINLKLPTTYS